MQTTPTLSKYQAELSARVSQIKTTESGKDLWNSLVASMKAAAKSSIGIQQKKARKQAFEDAWSNEQN